MAYREVHIPPTTTQIIRRQSMETYMIRIYSGPLSQESEYVSVEAEKNTCAIDITRVAVQKLKLGKSDNYEIAEVFISGDQLCKERRLEVMDTPVGIQLLWPKIINADIDRGQGLLTGYRFYLRKKDPEVSCTSGWVECKDTDRFLISFLNQPKGNKEYTDLCNLPNLNEMTLLENLKSRFKNDNIYTYVGSILIAVNPFKFFPIYNPKYVKMYQNRRLGELPPHIFAIADAAYYTMLRTKKNQCIVISGESGSGKTESTNLLLHHLTALSHKGLHGSGVEQTILGAGPVLEAFGNAKTVHNNNSSRFGKFIQVNYKENGMVHGAIVEKYLLEKSRIVSQAKNERNYHVFYYLLAGADDTERHSLHLTKPEEYNYLSCSNCVILEGTDEKYEFARLKQSMEMVGFSPETQRRIFSVLSAVLHLGNIEFKKKGDQHHDESVSIKNEDTVEIISNLLKVKEKTVIDALTQKKTIAGGETVVINYKMEDAISTRNAMAKCIYGALFDWIVLKVNQALLAKKHNSDHQGNSIGVLDIFGFEDFGTNSYEQFCINYANEHLQYYFNQHIFKFEQEEYQREGIQWKNIEFIDNTRCLELFSSRPKGLFCLLDEECNFPGATNETLLSKFTHVHKDNVYYNVPTLRESAFVIMHYAGKVKYQTKDFREKNSDQIRTDIVGVLKKSSLSFVRELMGIDPVAVLRWAIVRAFFRCFFAFLDSGKKWRKHGEGANVIAKKRLSDTQLLQDQNDGLLNGTNDPNSQPLSDLHGNACDQMDSDDDVFVKRHGPNGDVIDNLILSTNLENNLPEAEAKHIRRARKLISRNKSFKPKPRPPSLSFRDIKTLKAIAGRSTYGGGGYASKRQPPSVSAQFQWSLSRLMQTLNQANPFFIRCIKSNADKAACDFNEEIVLRQLRYTGMLATVKIRQSGYNYRLTFEEFIQLYKILLPRGLVSSKEDVKNFLENMELSLEHYQIGKTKVFLRESEKMLLDEALHRAIMERVVRIQRWMKSYLERKLFIRLRWASLIMQKYVRRFLAVKKLNRLRLEDESTQTIQRYYRGYKTRKWFNKTLENVITLQAHIRSFLAQKQFQRLREEKEKQRLLDEQRAQKRLEDMQSSTSDEGVLMKGSSAEELEIGYGPVERRDSEASSGILADSENDTLEHEVNSRGGLKPVFIEQSPVIIKDIKNDTPKSQKSVQEIASKFQNKDETDGRSILLRRGSKRGQRPAVAPLAKQESFSDLMERTDINFKDNMPLEPSPSPTNSGPNIVHVLSPEQRAEAIRAASGHAAAVEKMQNKLQEPDKSETQKEKSPMKAALKKMLGGRKKKDAPDSDEEDEQAQNTKRPQDLGVSVLPPIPNKVPPPPRSPGKKDEFLANDIKHGWRQQDGKKKRKNHRQSQKQKQQQEAQQSSMSINSTSQWQYAADLVIRDIQDVIALDEFVGKKYMELFKDSEKRSYTIFDKIFKGAIEDFRKELKALIGVEMQRDEVSVKYRDLLSNFEQVLKARVIKERTTATFPVTMGINAFHAFLDGFMKAHPKKKEKKEEKKTEAKHFKRDKKKDNSCTVDHLGHKFLQVQFNIPTFCELCSSLIWIMEKGQVCQICKYTCHKKCCTKSSASCKGTLENKGATGAFLNVPLQSMIGKDQKIPPIVEKLISAIELQGMFTEGIYRKSGSAPKVRSLIQDIDANASGVELENYAVHVLATVLKRFFRDLPEPLMTFDLYDNFLMAAEIKDDKERLQTLSNVIEGLPKPNYDLFERLIFHLSRIAMHEDSNKMSAPALAIIFAPCLLRSNKKFQAQECLQQVPRQNLCLENIITERLKKLKSTFNDINTLESAEKTATDRLTYLRASIRSPKSRPVSRHDPLPPIKDKIDGEEVEDEEVEELKEEERVLSAQIASIHQERENLTSTLPMLDFRQGSSDEDMLTGDEFESSFDPMDERDDFYEEYAVTFDLPVVPPGLQYPNKRRAAVPHKRPPKKYSSFFARSDSRTESFDSVEEDYTDCSSVGNNQITVEARNVTKPHATKDDGEIMV
ncbi:unconventional myosin-IXa isoform X3 [Patella vulgata]|uniref:unconventional myosin-IXa isoform X3 n=1 Tax=Patella vulgata TaxID=6465 RepID=UPI0024A814E0|nr:unconventional myosin-IXa isoform X3 [Patella vulgata]